jgi:hypothetical protein
VWPFAKDDRRDAWTAPPARPCHYPLRERLRDQYAGYRDGRRGLPRVDAPTNENSGEDLHPHVGTPKLEELRRIARASMALERLAAERDCAAIVNARNEAGARELVEQAEVFAMRLAQRSVDASPRPGENALTARRFAEVDHPESLVRTRRAADHERNRDALEAAYDSARRAASDARRAEAEIKKLVEARREAARIRAMQLHEHAWRRVAVYWRQLVRSHPDGAALNERLKPVGPDLPAWAQEPEPNPVQEKKSS